MNCIICNSRVNDLNIKEFNLLKEKPVMCLKCKSKYLPAMRFCKIPIKNYEIWHFYVTEKNVPKEAYIGLDQYFKPYYLLASHYNLLTLVFDTIPTDNELIECLDQLNMGDIIMITYDYGKEILNEI